MNHRDRLRPGASIALLMLVAAACTAGTSDEPTPTATNTSVPTATEAAATSAPSATSTPSATPSPVTETITIAGVSFGPPEITVPVGDLTFVNTDALPHTVTEGQNGAAAPGARFDTFIAAGDTIVITLDTPGDYQITCQFHAQMHVVVHAR